MLSAVVSGLWDNAPTATRCILCAFFAISAASVLLPMLPLVLMLTFFGFVRGHVLPLLTYWVAAPPLSLAGPFFWLLGLIFSAGAALVYFAELERQLGTLRFAAWFLVNAIAIGVLYLCITLVISQVSPTFGMMPCIGLWPLLMTTLTRRSLDGEKGSMISFWGILQIPARWYPLFLLAIFSLLSAQLQLDLLAGWLIGLATHRSEGGEPLHELLGQLRLPLHKLIPSQGNVIELEDTVTSTTPGHALGTADSSAPPALQRCKTLFRSLPLALLRRLYHVGPLCLRRVYIPGGGGELPVTEGTTGVAPISIGRTASTSSPAPAGNSFVAFSGSGNRLGDS